MSRTPRIGYAADLVIRLTTADLLPTVGTELEALGRTYRITDMIVERVRHRRPQNVVVLAMRKSSDQ